LAGFNILGLVSMQIFANLCGAGAAHSMKKGTVAAANRKVYVFWT
jgi:hypothetical protein